MGTTVFHNFELYNVAALIPHQNGGWNMSRVPPEVRTSMGEQGQRMACNTAGCEFRFVLNAGQAEITLKVDAPGGMTRGFLYYGSVQAGWETLYLNVYDHPTTLTIGSHPNPAQLETMSKAAGYDFDTKVIRLVFDSTQLVLLDAKGDVRPPRPEETPARRFMMYGSSITHGSLACAANLTYLAQIAEHLNCDFYSFGFAGSCRMEQTVCDYISEQENEINPRRWDFAILELGINALDLTAEEFGRRVQYLIDAMLRKNPGKKLYVIDIFYHYGDLAGNEKADQFRSIVRTICVNEGNDHPEIYYVEGRKMLTSPRGLSGDFVHPNVAGVREIAENLTKVLVETDCFH